MNNQEQKAAVVLTAEQQEVADLKEMLKQAKAKLREKIPMQLTLKVSQKGAVSVYGLGKFPVTLYAKQMHKLLEQAEQIKAFIETNKAALQWEKQVKVEGAQVITEVITAQDALKVS